MNRKRFVVLLLLATVTFLVGFMDEDNINKNNALKSACAWLLIQDSGDYKKSWEDSSELLKTSVDKIEWENKSLSLYSDIGKLEKRTFISSKYLTNLPKSPKGEYVVIVFDSIYTKKGKLKEIITPKKDEDGYWRVSGYYAIKND